MGHVTIMSRLGGFYFCRMVIRILLWIRKQTHDTILIYNNRRYIRIAQTCRKYDLVTFALGGYSTTRTELAGAGGGGGGAVSCCVWQSVVKCFFVTRQYT